MNRSSIKPRDLGMYIKKIGVSVEDYLNGPSWKYISRVSTDCSNTQLLTTCQDRHRSTLCRSKLEMRNVQVVFGNDQGSDK